MPEKARVMRVSRDLTFCQGFSSENFLAHPQCIFDAVDKRIRANTITANSTTDQGKT
jgi:hypothetical protein